MMDAKLRLAFRDPLRVFVRVTPSGFLLDDRTYESLSGKVARTRLIRKRFEEGRLLCASSNGTESREGASCGECNHPRCRPQLRLHLRNLDTIYILDLAASSAKNLLSLEDDLLGRGKSLEWTRLRLTVIDRGHWGEVCFEALTE